MNSVATSPSRRLAPHPLVSAGARLATLAGVATLVATVWLSAEQASHEAVRTSQVSLSRSVIYVTLPTVQVVGYRPAAATASAALGPRDRRHSVL